ncbi:MAG: glycogen debranching protein GlgX [Alphaproteobacteria bacterium]|nr:glycogen debranching protein GlgX [Alphaproteobacteria bacterium]
MSALVSLTELNIGSGIVSSGVSTVPQTEGACLKQAITDQTGRSFPLGATVTGDGVNFSVFSRQASRLELLLFDDAAAAQPARVIGLDARTHRTYHYWHAFVPGIAPGQIYAFRASGPFDPARGLRFDPDKALLDPYGRAVAVPQGYCRHLARRRGDNTATAMKSVVVDLSQYDWECDAPLRRPFTTTVIYEMHVAGFTRHQTSGVTTELRGTYAGLIEKIPYLQDLGITAVELLPIFQFDRQDAPPGLVNYWGYSPVSFFAPHTGYSSRKDPLGPVDEFRDLVKALHHAGIEVILDVVYNHTAEGNAEGPTLCFRGLANEIYYMLDKDRAQYANYSGTGNTLNANQSIVRRMIVDSLRYWVAEMHVDGFRFDLASILARDETGRPLENPPVLWDIESDPILAGTKLIAEAWDAAGLYQVGTFVGDSWMEWNGRFRDDVRGFVKADAGSVRRLAQRMLGSPDIFGHQEREPEQSINFVTCHDGFTLNDLVSYNLKHNEANGEGNRDGADSNLSWNCGAEGPTDDAEAERLRCRQIKNFVFILLISVGTPMLQMGDEMRRSQHGNNNAYCQDNETSWLDWSLVDRHRDLYRFVQTMIAQRLRWMAASGEEAFALSLNELLRRAEIEWHGVRLGSPDWTDNSHSIAFTLRSGRGPLPFWLHVMFNAYWEALDFDLPPAPAAAVAGWRRWIDTSLDAPDDLMDVVTAPLLLAAQYRVAPRSVVALFARTLPQPGQPYPGAQG